MDMLERAIAERAEDLAGYGDGTRRVPQITAAHSNLRICLARRLREEIARRLIADAEPEALRRALIDVGLEP